MPSSVTVPIINDRAAEQRRGDRQPFRLPLTIIVPSARVGSVEFGTSDSFAVVLGETLDLTSDGVSFLTTCPVPGSELLLQLDWPGHGPVMVRATLLRAHRVATDCYECAARIEGVVSGGQS